MKNHPRIQNWSSYLKKYRKLHGLTQVRLADLLQISVRVVMNWECAANRPPEYLKFALKERESKIERNRRMDNTESRQSFCGREAQFHSIGKLQGGERIEYGTETKTIRFGDEKYGPPANTAIKGCDIYHDNLQALEKKYAELLAGKNVPN